LDDYEQALAAGDLTAAAEALAGAANKEISPESVAEVNKNMGIASTPEEEAEIAALAEAARTAGTEEGEAEPGEDQTADSGSGNTTSTDGEDDAISAAADDLIGGSETETVTQ
jgi:hypothetical protein